MTLKLSGEEFSVVRGLDGMGWLREIDASADANPGLKVTPGTGPALSIEKNNSVALRQLKAGGGYADMWKLDASNRIAAGADMDMGTYKLYNAVLGSSINVNSQQLSKVVKLQGPDTSVQQDVEIETWDAGYKGARIILENAYGAGNRGRLRLYTSSADFMSTVERMTLQSHAAQGSAPVLLYENLAMQTVGGKYQSVALPVKAGALDDADFNTVQNGLMALDSTNNRVYFRVGGAWKYASLT